MSSLKKKKLLIISAQSDFNVPPTEAVRKQIIYEAKFQKNIYYPKVLVLNPKLEKSFVYENIQIKLVKKKNIFKYFNYINSFERIHFIGNIGLFSYLVAILFKGNEKHLYITDGGVYSINKKYLIKFLSFFLSFFYKNISYYTEFQRKLLCKSNCLAINFKKIKPYVSIDHNLFKTKIKSSNTFKVLFMGYLSKNKGADTLLDISENLIQKINNISFIFAINNFSLNDRKLFRKLQVLKSQYPNKFFIKGKVNINHELKNASLYYYCLKSQLGTFAFPMSIYESIAMGTPIIGPNIDGISEFFDKSLLVNPNNKEEITNLIFNIYKNPKKYTNNLFNKFHLLKNKVTRI